MNSCHTCGRDMPDKYHYTHFKLELVEESGLDRKRRTFCSPDCLAQYVQKTFRLSLRAMATEGVAGE